MHRCASADLQNMSSSKEVFLKLYAFGWALDGPPGSRAHTPRLLSSLTAYCGCRWFMHDAGIGAVRLTAGLMVGEIVGLVVGLPMLFHETENAGLHTDALRPVSEHADNATARVYRYHADADRRWGSDPPTPDSRLPASDLRPSRVGADRPSTSPGTPGPEPWRPAVRFRACFPRRATRLQWSIAPRCPCGQVLGRHQSRSRSEHRRPSLRRRHS